MATYDDIRRYQRGPSAPSMQAQQTATNSVAATSGVQAATRLSGVGAVNEQLASMKSDASRMRDARVVNRAYDTPALRAQAAQQYMTRVSSGLDGQGQPFRFDMRKGAGVAMDDQFVNDMPYYSPETAMFIQEGQQLARREVANAMAGMNKEAIRRPEDLNTILNQLPSIQKYGPLVESYVRNMVGQQIDPGLKAKLEAEDRTRSAFAEWASRRGVVDTPEAPVLDMYDSQPDLRRQFDMDPSAPKFEVGPDGKSVIQRPLTQEQQVANRIGLETSVADAQFGMNKRRWDEAVAQDPTITQRQRFNMATGQVEDIPPPNRVPTIEDARAASDAQNAAFESAGSSKRSVVYADPTKPEGYSVMTVDMPQPGSFSDMGNDRFKKLDPAAQEKLYFQAETLRNTLASIEEQGTIKPESAMERMAIEARASLKTLEKVYGLKAEEEQAGAANPVDVNAAVEAAQRILSDPTNASPEQIAAAQGILDSVQAQGGGATGTF